jgi:regulator of protease activity HflC (stomatin/prohibitin superfamily)
VIIRNPAILKGEDKVGALTGALMAALLLGILAAVVIGAATARTHQTNYRAATLVGLIVALLVLLASAMASSFTQVEAGSIAVVKQFGRAVAVFQPGLNFKMPFIQQTVVYRTQEIIYETSEDPTTSQADYRDLEVDTATADGQQIRARYTIRFRIDPTQAMFIVNNLGTEGEVVEKVVKATSRVHVRNILKQHVASDLYSGNVEKAQEQISTRLQQDFAKEGVQLVFFGLRSVQFEDAYRNAVEQKQIENENIKTKQYQAQQAEFEKQRTITQAQAEAERQKLETIGAAQGEAEAIKVKAQANAEAIKVKAQAQAEANKLISTSLDANVIGWQAIQQWSGNYPLVLGSQGSSNSFILPGELFIPRAVNDTSNSTTLVEPAPTPAPIPAVAPTAAPTVAPTAAPKPGN